MRAPLLRSTSAQVILTILLLLFISAASFTAGVLARPYLPFLVKDQLVVLREAHAVLEANFIGDLPSEQQLEYGMIQGMLSKLGDPYTVFVEPAQHELQTNQLEGKFGGIGARLERDASGYLLLFPFPGSPAEGAGIVEGTRLLAADGLAITPDLGPDAIQAAIRGPVGKPVVLQVAMPPDYQEQTLAVERKEIALPSVTWNLAPDEKRVGVIQVNIIAATTPGEVSKAVQDLQSQGADRFVLDLRNNAGGLLSAGVDTAKLFLPRSIVLMQQYRGKAAESIVNDQAGIFVDLPLAVLVNHGSASAAEIIAGALQAQGRAVIIGSNSYGKDTIQLVFDLSDGSSLHVTAAKWWVPGLQPPLKDQGLIPDVLIAEENVMEPEALQAAVNDLMKTQGVP